MKIRRGNWLKVSRILIKRQQKILQSRGIRLFRENKVVAVEIQNEYQHFEHFDTKKQIDKFLDGLPLSKLWLQ